MLSRKCLQAALLAALLGAALERAHASEGESAPRALRPDSSSQNPEQNGDFYPADPFAARPPPNVDQHHEIAEHQAHEHQAPASSPGDVHPNDADYVAYVPAAPPSLDESQEIHAESEGEGEGESGAGYERHLLRSSGRRRYFGRFPEKEYLSNELAETACKLDRGCSRKEKLNNTYLSYCSRYKLDGLLSNEVLMSLMHDSSDECERILDEFIQLDELINQFDQLFKNLLLRYNCHNGYSVKWSCEDCKRAYKDWLCATSLPFYMNGERVKPCISFCERVEQRCPYLHPITKEQYGGQPVFICRDPNIPFVPEITPDIPYSEPSKCYDMCHLSDNITELLQDTLSRYEYDKCPDHDLVAEEVRSDPLYCRSADSVLADNQHPHSAGAQHNDSQAKAGSWPADSGHGHELPHAHDGSPALNETSSARDRAGAKAGAAKQAPHPHMKKLGELREVLAIYKSQPKTHKFGHPSEHASLGAHHSSSSSLLEPRFSWTTKR